MKSPRLTQRDLETILTALNMIDAGDWDEGSYGPRPDFESVIEKIRARIKE